MSALLLCMMCRAVVWALPQIGYTLGVLTLDLWQQVRKTEMWLSSPISKLVWLPLQPSSSVLKEI